ADEPGACPCAVCPDADLAVAFERRPELRITLVDLRQAERGREKGEKSSAEVAQAKKRHDDARSEVAFALLVAGQRVRPAQALLDRARQRKESLTRQLKYRQDRLKEGGGELREVVQARRELADAVRDEQFALAELQTSCAQYERQKGTLSVK